ncbi:hypothetical protein [Mycolicibacterium sp. HK-90]|uniref:hypothetical protein n=1 Tax=Mycolicibacterium sp. HK-90 TaxID=3056937 RepID=UPI00265A1E49|nr:hypothetical protein [Mycolicibacterium sp. HK-90]WKG05903.1 hypothetical protein QU592_12835 [Mycolicibacterium sp. HK-90]
MAESEAPGVEPDGPAAESIVLVRDSEAVRLLQPVRYGGRAAAVAEFVSEVADLAERDGSAGWLAAAVNAAAYQVASLGEAAAEQVWGTDATALVTACGDVSGRLTRQHGHLELTGRWDSVTGAATADWFQLSALDEGATVCVLVPRDTVQVEQHVDRHGLADAGIGDVAVTDAAVDESAVFRREADIVSGTEQFDDPDARIVTGAGQAAAVIGAASGVWRAHVGQVRRRLATSYGSEDAAELTSSAVLVARAASDIDAARLQLTGSLGATAPDAATAQRQAVARARNAADQLLGSGSRHALDTTDPVARLWLDVLAGYRLTIRGIADDSGARR